MDKIELMLGAGVILLAVFNLVMLMIHFRLARIEKGLKALGIKPEP